MRVYRGAMAACALALLLYAVPASGESYYVRPDGGTAEQCDGKADAPYPGSGLRRPCAWKSLFTAVLWDGKKKNGWCFKGGDTVIFSPGSHRIGYDPEIPWCKGHFPYGCKSPPLPSGTAGRPTVIAGKGWDTGCRNKPLLWGAEFENHLLSLEGSSHVRIECLEMTDRDPCILNHKDTSFACNRTKAPYGDYALIGIYAADSADVAVRNVDIHGLALDGIVAARLADWTLENVRLAMNGYAGWNGDIRGDDVNRGTIRFDQVAVEYNGCGEENSKPVHCTGQYGDGIGTGPTCGQWIVERSVFRRNTSDGLDLLYVRQRDKEGMDVCATLGIPTNITIRDTIAEGNAGNQIKTGGRTRMENVIAEGNCSFFYRNPIAPLFPGGKEPIQHCRAFGNVVSVTPRFGTDVSIVNSTIVGEGDNALLISCLPEDRCGESGSIVFVNNIVYGYGDFLAELNGKGAGDKVGLVYTAVPELLEKAVFDHNLYCGVKIPPYPGFKLGSHSIWSDPGFVDDGGRGYGKPPRDLRIRPKSAAVGGGLPPGGKFKIPECDVNGTPRDRTRPTIGAYEAR